MNINVKTQKAKEAMISIVLDVKSAEVLRLFLDSAIGTEYMASSVVSALYGVDDNISECDVAEIVNGIINGLSEEVDGI